MSMLNRLGQLWVSPITVPATLLFLLLGAKRKAGLTPNAIVVVAPKFLQNLFSQFVVAFTLGNLIVFSRESFVSDRTLRHELEHVKQWQILGPFFLPSYLFASIYASVVYGDGYSHNIFEKWAQAKE